MATTLFAWRPSALPAVCPPILSDHDIVAARASVLGIAAVTGKVRTAPIFVEPGRALPTKINNYIGAPAAPAAAGTAVPKLAQAASVAITRSQQVKVDMVKGADARGIPPRGRRKV